MAMIRTVVVKVGMMDSGWKLVVHEARLPRQITLVLQAALKTVPYADYGTRVGNAYRLESNITEKTIAND